MDWGFLDSNAGENKFLREEVVYPWKVGVLNSTDGRNVAGWSLEESSVVVSVCAMLPSIFYGCS